jgi:hypothetical protein
MCKIRIDYKIAKELLNYHVSQCQSLNMALYDLAEMGEGYKLYYVLDGYDFNQWLFSPEKNTPVNRFGPLMKKNWADFFSLSDGKRTCAVLSPFTIIQFLERARTLLDDRPIRTKIQQFDEIMALVKKIEDGEQTFEEIPGQHRDIIRNLYAQIVDLKYAEDLLVPQSAGQPDPFLALRTLISEGKIQVFNPPAPPATQVSELLRYDGEKTQRAIKYLREKREQQSRGSKQISSTLDAYHYVLVQNCRNLWKDDGAIPNLTSSGILTRNSWYLLAYGNLPGFTDLFIPPDWSVRAGNEPSLLLTVLSYHKGDPRKAKEFMEDARSNARQIQQDLQLVPEIQRGLGDTAVRNRFTEQNPKIEVYSSTIDLIRRLNERFFKPLSMDQAEISRMGDDINIISREDAKMLREYVEDPAGQEARKRAAASQLVENVKRLDLPLASLQSYIAPMGDGAEELINSVNSFIESSSKNSGA